MFLKIKLIFFSVCCLLPVLSFSQMSGTYTVGGLNPDFVTLTDAATALNGLGISGPVLLNIRDGVYNGHFILSASSNTIPASTITFQSESGDSSAVTIVNSNPNYKAIYSFEPCIFNRITIIDSSNYAIDSYDIVEIYNCRIMSPQSGIKASHLTIANSFIMGFSGATYENNYYDNEIYGTTGGFASNSIFLRNHINGDIQTTSSRLENNYVFGNVSVDRRGSIFKNNIIIGTGPGASLRFSFCDRIVCSNNYVAGDVSFDHGDTSVIMNNEIVGNCSFVFMDHNKMTGNKIAGATEFSFSDYNLFYNNFIGSNANIIGGDMTFAYSNYNLIAFNSTSLHPGSLFQCMYSYHNIIENNIMPSIYSTSTYLNTVSNNNYPNGGGQFDSNPFFIDPQYQGFNNLHATNPQLMGKAIPNPAVLYDIDSLARPPQPTIGANEICFSADTVYSFCGDSIFLSLCDMPLTGNFTWSPVTGLNDNHAAKPSLLVSGSSWYSVNDTNSGFEDSVFVSVQPFQVNASDDDSIKVCGNSVLLHCNYLAGATYQWSPIDSLSSPTSYFTTANPSQTTTYIVTVTTSGCGTYSDTVHILVNPLPFAYTYLDSVNYNFFSFLNVSTCADSYQWDFGDSTYSSDAFPDHTYTSEGQFLVTIIACNSFGCDTFQGFVVVDTIVFTGVVENLHAHELGVYPNPASDEIIISLSHLPDKKATLTIYNNEGEIVKQQEFANASFIKTNIRKFSPGIYLLKVITGNRQYVKKIVVQRK